MYVIGIDPGYGMTGLVLVDDAGNLLDSYTLDRAPGEHEGVRAVNHANEIAGKLDEWIIEKCPPDVRVGIETPTFNGNPLTYSKQWRLIQAIESNLCALALQLKAVKITLAEVNPKTSKRVLTGNGDANKADMVDKSPFQTCSYMPLPEREALADAWGHAAAARVAKDVEEL